MAKIPILKKQQKQRMPDFDLSDLMMDDSPADEVVVGMMSGLIEAYRHQQQVAIELTKLAIENNMAESMSEEEIFSTFKRASQIVGEMSPIKELWDKMNGQ